MKRGSLGKSFSEFAGENALDEVPRCLATLLLVVARQGSTYRTGFPAQTIGATSVIREAAATLKVYPQQPQALEAQRIARARLALE
jgi:hypothetical protein